MPTIHLSAHHKSGKRFLAVGQTDESAKIAIYASVGRSNIPKNFEFPHEYAKLMKHLREFEEMVGEKAFLITQDGKEWSLRRELCQDQCLYELDDMQGVKTYQL
jgi:hypothetical protein